MKLESGHTSLGVFVVFPHECPGFECCAIAAYVKRQQARARRRFYSEPKVVEDRSELLQRLDRLVQQDKNDA